MSRPFLVFSIAEAVKSHNVVQVVPHTFVSSTVASFSWRATALSLVFCRPFDEGIRTALTIPRKVTLNRLHKENITPDVVHSLSLTMKPSTVLVCSSQADLYSAVSVFHTAADGDPKTAASCTACRGSPACCLCCYCSLLFLAFAALRPVKVFHDGLGNGCRKDLS